MFLWYLDQIIKHTHPPTYGLQTSQIRGAHDWSYQSEWFLFATMFFSGFLVEKRTTFSSEKSQEKSWKQVHAGVQNFRSSENFGKNSPETIILPLNMNGWKISMPLLFQGFRAITVVSGRFFLFSAC